MAEPLKRGDLYFVKPPGFVGKVRPAVIVQADKYNADPPSATVCLLTSHLVDSKLRVRIDPATGNGLTKSSHVMIDKVMSLPFDRLDNPFTGVTGSGCAFSAAAGEAGCLNRSASMSCWKPARGCAQNCRNG